MAAGNRGREVATILLRDRGTVYGIPAINLACSAELKEVYRRYALTYGPMQVGAHLDAMENLLQKVARIATGKYHADNYADIHGYCQIAQNLQEQHVGEI